MTVIPFSCFIKDENFNQKKELFLNLAMIKSIILIFIGTIIVHDGDFRVFRDWAYSFGLGDIYFLNRFIPKVQVHGNALLVIAFMLDCLSDKKITKRKILLLLGVLVAGNFAFILALLAFIAWQAGTFAIKLAKRNKYVKYISIAVIIIAVAVLVPYFISKIVEKAATSNAVRLEQAKVFLDANPFIGDGLGCWVTAQTEHLSYNGEIYFELQTLYIFKQVGIITLLLFYAVTLIPMYYAGKNRFIFYLIYLFFSFWNPYCFDVTQIITIILAINISQLGEVNDKIAYYSIPSGLLRQRKHS
ncbi:MAG: hypothetical protein IKL10_09805 [Clostridia bacterium]|nr:hypothetical protein [Clostridia bacterium]